MDDVTAIKTVQIYCDGCAGLWLGKPNQTTFSARTDAKAAGWRHQGGRDWCPDHAGRKT